ncbi:GLUTAMATE RECEPTOR 2.9 [Salix koriyanagi]|uniref:Glutamate receptor n=1 Tax=Salix koriyanagi TaxID=2511006 RepID=A0A9Q0W1L8_9ROSI|nr:GLUTAMATE RECEPTOR 2.9 [Salix koriyanagi]
MRKTPFKPVLSFLLFLCLKILFIEMGVAQNTTFIPVNVGVALDLGSDLDGKIALSCINMAVSNFYANHGDYKTRMVLTTRDSKKDVVGAAAAALDLIKNVEVQAILGPTTSMQADFIIGLGEKAQVPIISFSASSPSLTSIRSPYFFRATQNDSSQVNGIGALVQAFGWKEAVPIYMDNEYGQGIIPYLTDALQAVDAHVPYRSVISPSATDDQIAEELYKLMTMQTRVFIVHMFTSLCARLFVKAKEIGMMNGGYVWIMTDGPTVGLSTSPDPSVIDSMQGALGIKPYIPKTTELGNFRLRWKMKFQQDNADMVDAELNIYALQAYDATVALAMAIEKTGTANLGFREANVSNTSATDLENLGISQNGPNLLRALSNTSFKGLTGDFFFNNGQLQLSAFEIVNMNANGGRRIGFWMPRKGLAKTLNSIADTTSTYSTSKSSLAPVIWAGDSTSIPKGWEIPTNGKKLRIGVPSPSTFGQFVKETTDLNSNTTTVTGYSIAIFEAAVDSLPYAITYEYIPFVKPDGKFAGTYNDLVYQVYLKKYDAVVGDTTIIANRSKYVDFTLPYTESGVSMIVPIKDSRNKNAWVFLKPLTWDLWFTSFCFFVFIGFVVWVLENGINEDFQGSSSHQIGTSFWFSFSTMVFPIGSPLVADVSRAVLRVTEGDRMKEIEDAWLGTQSSCQESSTSFSSNSLSLKSFWGLFLITGIASISALMIFTTIFVYEHRAVLLQPSDLRATSWSRILVLFRILIQMNKTSSRSELNPNHIAIPGDLPQADNDDDRNPNAQQPDQEEVQNINQLVVPNQERPAATEVNHENN